MSINADRKMWSMQNRHFYFNIFHIDFSLAFHKPTKEMCDLCEKCCHSNNTEKDELKKKMEEHLKNKKRYLLRMTRQLMFHASIYSKYSQHHTVCHHSCTTEGSWQPTTIQFGKKGIDIAATCGMKGLQKGEVTR